MSSLSNSVDVTKCVSELRMQKPELLELSRCCIFTPIIGTPDMFRLD